MTLRPCIRLITSITRATTNRMWTNPPSVYEVANPSAHMIKRITKIVQSIVQLLILRESLLSKFLASQVFSSIFLIALLFGFRGVIDRVGALASDELLSLLHDHVGSLAQLARLLIQVVQAFTAAFTEDLARLFTAENRGH